MNKNIWDLYKNSERGKDSISLFTFDCENDDLEVKAKDIFKKYNEYFGGIDDEELFLDRCFLIIDSININDLFLEENENAFEYFERLIDNLEISFIEENSEGELVKVENERPIIQQKDYKSFCGILTEISLILYLYGEPFFIPMLFREQFDIFIKILDLMDIPMPEMPAKSNKRERLLLYNELNKSITKFAEANSLSKAETCACFYDFAIMLFEDDEKLVELPEPTNIWLTGGSKEDYKKFLKNPVKGAKSEWTGNENTKRGDIIVMYVTAPYSCIQSIWRADIDGVYTPFNYYNSRTRATDGIVIPHITFNELKEDPYFSQLPIIRKNLQGLNGVQFSANDYKELQRLLKEKGFDTYVLPQLYRPDLEIEKNLKNEKDVEEKLLIPLLSKLGFAETDWTRQLSQKAGRNEKVIPDFVFLPKGEIHFQNAPMIIEAKFDMSSNLERTKSYNQALSYARMMQANIFGICDKDRLIIYKEKKGLFDRFKPTFEKHWQSINNEEVFRQLKLLIGKEIINKN
jgi:hypothetical protein